MDPMALKMVDNVSTSESNILEYELIVTNVFFHFVLRFKASSQFSHVGFNCDNVLSDMLARVIPIALPDLVTHRLGCLLVLDKAIYMVLSPMFGGGDLKDVCNAEQGLPGVAVRDDL